MARWTGSWLSGPEVTLSELRNPEGWPGKRLGLPKEGANSIAPFSTRAFAFVLDLLASGLVAGLLVVAVTNPSGVQRQGAAYLVLGVTHVLFVAATGQTLGMRLMGLKVLKLGTPDQLPGVGVALLRTLPLVLTLGLSGFFTRDGRGLHDVVAGSAVVRV